MVFERESSRVVHDVAAELRRVHEEVEELNTKLVEFKNAAAKRAVVVASRGQKADLTTLPYEVVRRMALFIDVPSMLNAVTVCHRWRSLLESNHWNCSEIQHHRATRRYLSHRTVPRQTNLH